MSFRLTYATMPQRMSESPPSRLRAKAMQEQLRRVASSILFSGSGSAS